MNSLGSKIQLAFIVSISVIAVCALVMLSINQVNSLQTQRIVDRMTTEYSLISISNDLVQSYNAVTKNPTDPQVTSHYESLHTNILSTLTSLNKTITQQETRILFAGVEHTVRAVLDDCDKGIAEIKQNNFTSLSDHYAQANSDNGFVNDNTRTLLENELKILYTSQQSLQRTYTITITGTVGLFLLIIGIIIALARSFTIQLVKPLTALSFFAKDIADGNLETHEKQAFEITNDEIGSLTQSVQTMVRKLIEMIDKEHSTNDELKHASDTLSENNSELQRMNALMIGRELKMTELKKEIEELKSKINTTQNTSPQ